jgi:hypothetical protein
MVAELEKKVHVTIHGPAALGPRLLKALIQVKEGFSLLQFCLDGSANMIGGIQIIKRLQRHTLQPACLLKLFTEIINTHVRTCGDHSSTDLIQRPDGLEHATDLDHYAFEGNGDTITQGFHVFRSLLSILLHICCGLSSF